jgi:transposase
MKPWKELTHFAALDWADDHHDLVVVDAGGQVMLELTFEHNAQGWQQAQRTLAQWPGLPVALETSAGPAVDQLVQRGFTVYPVMPKAAARYRERKRPTGPKDDLHDAWSLADALRTDGHGWCALSPLDPLTAELRALCRDEVALIEQRTALVNQLQAALKEYYPAVLEAFEDWTAPSAWAFVLAFPTPTALVNAGKRKWEKFLHTHKLWRPQTASQRLEIFARASEFSGSVAITAAKSLLAQSLARLLQTLEHQLEVYRARIRELFNKHPDHELFGSLPGAGSKLAPRLLVELAAANWTHLSQVQARAGTAPVTYQSGQIRRVKIRRACTHWLRATLHLWADLSRHYSAWAAAYYRAHRDKGQSHACALRCLAHRWLEIIGAMVRTGTTYNPEKHLAQIQKHGSYVLKLIPCPETKSCE